MDDQVEEVKRRTDIVGVVGQYVTLKKSGRHHKGLCPFHGEKTPSFMVNEELGIYKCFGCGVGGDVISFLMGVEGIDFREALERLAEKAGIKLIFTDIKDKDDRQKLVEIMDLAARYYHWILTEGKAGEEARKYLESRKVNKKLIETFNIGYALPGWDNLISYLVKKKKYTEEMVARVGLVSKRNGGGYYDKFRGRIMFPLIDSSGRVVGFSGRILPSLAKEGEPKYLNSPETELYHKGQMLYGFYQSKQSIRESKRVIVVEGQMDMISSFGAGVAETVAVSGTSLTVDQVEMIARLARTIYLSLDADEAGVAAIMRSVEMAEKRGLEVKVVKIDGGKDPDEIARNSPGRWREMVEGAVDVYEFVMGISLKKNDISTVSGIRKVTEEVLPYLKKIENIVVREVWMKKLAERLGVDLSVVRSETTRLSDVGVKGASEEKKTLSDNSRKIDKLGKRLIGGLLLSERSRRELKPWISEIELSGGVGKAIIYLIKAEKETPVEIIADAPAELKVTLEEVYLEEGEGDVDQREVLGIAIQYLRETVREKRSEKIEELKIAIQNGEAAKEEELSKFLGQLDRLESKLLLILG